MINTCKIILNQKAMSFKEKDDQNRLKSPYNDDELMYFRDIILKKRDETVQELEILQKSIAEFRENSDNGSLHSSHMADVSMDVQLQEKKYILHNRTRKFLRYLDAALGRIENKTYGICKARGTKIAKGRLEAVPHTQLSIEAKLKHQ